MATSSLPIHRVRFVDYDPSPISALQFTPIPLPSADPSIAGKQRVSVGSEFGSLVVARQNGQVDIWEWSTSQVHGKGLTGTGSWVLDRVLPAALSHPSISLMLLVIRDPESFSRSNATRKVPTLAECRLFTSGTEDGELVERCLFTGRVLQTYPVPAAPIWALSVSPTQNTICIASSSSSLHLISLDAYSPEFEAASPIHRTEGLPGRVRTLSIAWGPPIRAQLSADADGTDDSGKRRWEWKNSYLITGNSDGSARKWNLSTGRMIGRMVVNSARKDPKMGGGITKSTIVWGVGVLVDHTVVTADSLGMVTFWDGRSQAQRQVFQGHAADAQCLVIGSSGRTVYTSGPDQKVSEFSLIGQAATAESSGSSREVGQTARWVHSSSKRLHIHDVRALAIWPPYSLVPGKTKEQVLPLMFAPVLASGGLDMQVVLTPAASPDQLSQMPAIRNPLAKSAVRAFSDSVQKGLGFAPLADGMSLVSYAPAKRLIALRRYRGIAIWRLARLDEMEDVMNKGYEKVLEMRLEIRTQLVSSALSRDGRWLAVSDLYETKLFRLLGGKNGAIHPKRIKSMTSALIDTLPHIPFELRGTGSATLTFSPDSNTLMMGLSMASHVVVVQLPSGGPASLLDEGLRVVKGFGLSGVGPQRVIRDIPKRIAHANGNGWANGNGAIGHHLADEMIVDDGASVSSTPGGENLSVDGDDDEESSDEEDEEQDNDAELSRRARARSCVISEDGEWGVVCTNGGKVMIFGLDVLKLHCILPSFGKVPISMTFLSPTLLALGFTTSPALQVYDVDTRRIREDIFPPAASSILVRQPEGLSGLLTAVQGVRRGADSGVPSRDSVKEKLIGWGAGWLAGLSAGPQKKQRKMSKKKRARETEGALTNGHARSGGEEEAGATTDVEGEYEGQGQAKGTVNNRFRSVLSVGRIGRDGAELVVVERPFMDLRDLPMAFAEKKYGT